MTLVCKGAAVWQAHLKRYAYVMRLCVSICYEAMSEVEYFFDQENLVKSSMLASMPDAGRTILFCGKPTTLAEKWWHAAKRCAQSQTSQFTMT